MKMTSYCCGAQLMDAQESFGVCAHCLEWAYGYEEKATYRD